MLIQVAIPINSPAMKGTGGGAARYTAILLTAAPPHIADVDLIVSRFSGSVKDSEYLINPIFRPVSATKPKGEVGIAELYSTAPEYSAILVVSPSAIAAAMAVFSGVKVEESLLFLLTKTGAVIDDEISSLRIDS